MSSQPNNHKWMVLSNTTLGMLAAAINASIVLISLPAAARADAGRGGAGGLVSGPVARPLTRLGLRPIHPLPDGERNRGDHRFRSILLPVGEKVARSAG